MVGAEGGHLSRRAELSPFGWLLPSHWRSAGRVLCQGLEGLAGSQDDLA